MARKRKLKFNEKPVYPSDYQAKAYAKEQQAAIEKGADCKKAFKKIAFSSTVTALATWGCKNIYFVYAFPSEGITVSKPEDVLDIQLLEGWIFQHLPQTGAFNLLIKASRDGMELFKSEVKRHKQS